MDDKEKLQEILDGQIEAPHSRNAKMLLRIYEKLQGGSGGGSQDGPGDYTVATDDDIDALFDGEADPEYAYAEDADIDGLFD